MEQKPCSPQINAAPHRPHALVHWLHRGRGYSDIKRPRGGVKVSEVNREGSRLANF